MIHSVADDYAQWTKAQVGQWLCSVDLEEHVTAFATAKIKGSHLTDLTNSILEKSLHISDELQRMQVMQAVSKLKEATAAREAVSKS